MSFRKRSLSDRYGPEFRAVIDDWTKETDEFGAYQESDEFDIIWEVELEEFNIDYDSFVKKLKEKTLIEQRRLEYVESSGSLRRNKYERKIHKTAEKFRQVIKKNRNSLKPRKANDIYGIRSIRSNSVSRDITGEFA